MAQATELKVANICRTCAKNYKNGEEPLIPIFYGAARNIIKQQYQNSKFNIHINDGLPQQICSECLDQLNDIHEFFIMCEKSHEYLINKFYPKDIPDCKNKELINMVDEVPFLVDNGGDIINSNEFKIEILDDTQYFDEEILLKVEEVEEEDVTVDDEIEKKLEEFLWSPSQNTETTNKFISTTNNEDQDQDEDEDPDEDDLDYIEKIDEEYKMDSNEMETEEELNDQENILRNKIDIIQENDKEYSIIDEDNNSSSHQNDNFDLLNKLENDSDSDDYFINEEMEAVKIIKCAICCMVFDTYRKLQTHIRFDHKKHRKSVLCEICGEDVNIKYIRGHKNKHETGSSLLYTCEYCSKKFELESSYKGHMYKHLVKTQPRYRCEVCQKGYMVLAKYQLHLKTAHINGEIHKKKRTPHTKSPRASIKCPYCMKHFLNTVSLIAHCKTHRKPDIKDTKHICKYCEVPFKRADHLKIHINTVHLKSDRYECKYCDKVFYASFILNSHVKKEHIMKPEKPKCDVCNKTLSSAQCVQRHKLEAHSTGKHFECPICEEKFRKRTELARHAKIHDGIIKNEENKQIIIKEFCVNTVEKK